MLTGLIDLTIVLIVAYLWLLKKWGVDATQPYRALLIVLWAVGAAYSFGFRV